jgi:hypothetical protein
MVVVVVCGIVVVVVIVVVKSHELLSNIYLLCGDEKQADNVKVYVALRR